MSFLLLIRNINDGLPCHCVKNDSYLHDVVDQSTCHRLRSNPKLEKPRSNIILCLTLGIFPFCVNSLTLKIVWLHVLARVSTFTGRQSRHSYRAFAACSQVVMESVIGPNTSIYPSNSSHYDLSYYWQLWLFKSHSLFAPKLGLF